MDSVLVVISHYNAWPTDQLLSLLDQLDSVDSGHPFDVLVVVNQAEQKPLELPSRHAKVRIFYRENTGYNIGAWDHGWRHSPGYTSYLFIQEECQIIREGWLEAFVRADSKPKVGLVGESINWRNLSWDRVETYYEHLPFPDPPVDGQYVSFHRGVKACFKVMGIPTGECSEHLQSLVLFARRDVLEAIDGFPIGRTYGQAVASEVAISKRVEAIGLRIRTVGVGYFRYILHPQWRYRQATIPRVVFTAVFCRVEPWIPVSIALMIRRTPSAIHEQLSRLSGAVAKLRRRVEPAGLPRPGHAPKLRDPIKSPGSTR